MTQRRGTHREIDRKARAFLFELREICEKHNVYLRVGPDSGVCQLCDYVPDVWPEIEFTIQTHGVSSYRIVPESKKLP